MNIKYYFIHQLKVTVHVFIIVDDIGIPSIRFRNHKDPIWMNGEAEYIIYLLLGFLKSCYKLKRRHKHLHNNI